MPDDSTFRFLGLPSEIRVDVYKFVFTRTTVDINNRLLDPDELHRIWDRGPDVEPRAQTNLLETCKKIRQEAIVCFQNSIKKLVIGRHGCGCRKCAILLSTSIKVSHQKFLQNVELVELNGYAAWNTLSLQGLALPLLERVTICMRTVLEEYRDSTCYLEDFKSGLHDTEFLRMAKECALRLSPWAEWQELIDWHLSPGSTTQLVLKIDGTSNWAAKPDEFGPVKQYFVRLEYDVRAGKFLSRKGLDTTSRIFRNLRIIEGGDLTTPERPRDENMKTLPILDPSKMIPIANTW